MSSARKRQKDNRWAAKLDSANQRMMLAQHHADVVGALAKIAAQQYDDLKQWQNDASSVMAAFITLSSTPDEQEWGHVAADAIRLLNCVSTTPPAADSPATKFAIS